MKTRGDISKGLTDSPKVILGHFSLLKYYSCLWLSVVGCSKVYRIDK